MRDSILREIRVHEALESHKDLIDNETVMFSGQVLAVEIWTVLVGAAITTEYSLTKVGLPLLAISALLNVMYNRVNKGSEVVPASRMKRQHKALTTIQKVLGITQVVFSTTYLWNLL